MAWQVVDAPLDFLEQVWNVLVIKGQAAAQQRIQDDAAAPDINLRPSIQLATDDLVDEVDGMLKQRCLECAWVALREKRETGWFRCSGTVLTTG